MKKTLVSMVAVLATAGIVSGAYADCAGSGCKAKKRVIRISAAEPTATYSDNYKETVIRDRAADTYVEEVKYEEPVRVKPRKERREEFRARPSYNEWYIGARVGAHMMSWKNKYSAYPDSAIADMGSNHDKYTFETVFGGGVFAGYHFTPNWRGDLEFAYLTEFSDSDHGITFKMSTPYLTGNVYYEFDSGFYLGGGVGLAFTKAEMDWQYFVGQSASDDKLSFTGALMAGYAHHLSDSLVLDLRYRLGGFWGPDFTGIVSQEFRDDGSTLETLKTEVGFVIDNSFSIGLRYEF